MRLDPHVFVRTLLVLALGAPALAQTTWYVDAAAAPPGLGTPAQPYTSIQYAVDQPSTQSDDTLLVAAGIYTENVSSPSKFLIFRSSSGPFLTEIHQAVPGSIVTFPNTYAGTTFSTLEGFRLLGLAGSPSHGISGGDVIVERCIIDAGWDASLANTSGISAGISVQLHRSTVINFSRAVRLNDFFGEPADTRLANSILDNGFQGVNLSLEYCLYEGQTGGAAMLAGNVQGPPGIWSLGTGDVHLKPFSLAIDAAHPGLPLDPDGSRADIGVIPYDPAYAATPTTYCNGKQHSGGCIPNMSFTGTPPFHASDDFHVYAGSALNNKPGFFIWGYTPNNAPFNGGTLCVASPIVRTPGVNTGGSATGADCTGQFHMHWTASYSQAHNLVPGTNVYIEAWGRDPGYAPPNNVQLSNAGVFEIHL